MPLFQRKPRQRLDFEREALPYLSALYGSAMRLTRNPDDAADLVQETLLRAYRFFDTFQPGTNCKAWLFRILHNVFSDRYREREREQQILSQAESSEVNLARFTAGVDGPAAPLSHGLSRQVEAALARLPADFRTAVILADLEDFSYKEIADIMGCPAGTVMSRLFRGRKLLQGLLAEHATELGVLSSPPDSPPAAPPIDLDAFRRETARSGARRRDGGAA